MKGNSIGLTWDEVNWLCEMSILQRKDRQRSCFLDREFQNVNSDIKRINEIKKHSEENSGIIQIIEEGEVHHYCESCTKEQKKKMEKESINDQ